MAGGFEMRNSEINFHWQKNDARASREKCETKWSCLFMKSRLDFKPFCESALLKSSLEE